MKQVLTTAIICITVILVTGFITSADKQPDSEPGASPFGSGVTVSPFSYPSYLEFAGEQVPLDDFDVKERLERELLVNCYWHSNTMYNMKLSSRWFPVIEPILARHGVPDDFKYLALAESGLRQPTSPAGAKGMWQFMKSAAATYGLEVNDEVDMRYNVEKSTEAACKYLLDAKAKFGNWKNAAASYNMGMAGLNSQMSRQKTDDYYDLTLNSETSRYLFRIIAMKEIFSNPSNYGFYLDYDEFYQPYQYTTTTVSGAVGSWADYARDNGTNYKKLKLMNPWLRNNSLRNSKGKTYEIKLPLM